MSKLEHIAGFLKAGALAAFVTVGAAGAAHATAVQFTWNPGSVGSNGSAFTSDKLNLLDYARIDLGATAGGQTAFTENGFLKVNNVSLTGPGGEVTFNPTGLNSTYSLYFAFSAAGVQNAPTFGQSSFGTLTSLNFSLYSTTANESFGIDGSNNPFVSLTGNRTKVATGTLLDGVTNFSVLQGGVSAGASAEGVLQELVSAFFVAPASLTLNYAAAFTNNVNILTLFNSNKSLAINGGNGDATFTAPAVPEPVSLALLGAGLLGFGIVRRRR